MMMSSDHVLVFSIPCLGWSPRPRNRPGGSIRKLPIFSLWPSMRQNPYSSTRAAFASFSAWNGYIDSGYVTWNFGFTLVFSREENKVYQIRKCQRYWNFLTKAYSLLNWSQRGFVAKVNYCKNNSIYQVLIWSQCILQAWHMVTIPDMN